jgi:prolipoprotein diacylglyceryltransferase
MGQILSLPMILAGLVMLVIAYRSNEPTGNIEQKRLAVGG